MTEEQGPNFTTPKRRTARMSTGGKPPRVKSLSPSRFLDLEAEESQGEESGEDLDRSLSDFIVDDEDDDGDAIPWEKSPTPTPRQSSSQTLSGDGKAGEDVDDPVARMTAAAKSFKKGNSGDDKDAAAPSERLTRSKTKSAESQDTGVKRWDPKTHRALVTTAHSRTGTDRNVGASTPSQSVKLGTQQVDTQRKLLTSDNVTVSAEDYAMFAKFKEQLAKEKLAATQAEDSSKSGSSSAAKQLTARGRSKNPMLPAAEITPISDDDDAQVKAKGKRVTKRKRVNSVESVHMPTASPAEAFAALKKKSLESPPSKTQKTSVDGTASNAHEVVLETDESIKRVTALPEQCQVTEVALQDPITTKVYIGLVNLLAGVLIAWSSRQGPGMFMFSRWADITPSVDFRSLWSFFVFASKARFVNLARASPLDFSAICQLYSNDQKRWVLNFNGSTAICISIINVVDCSVTSPRSVFSTAGSRKADKIPILKFITGIHLSQDYDRIVGLLRMVFDQPEMHAQLSEDTLTFGTKSTTPERQRKAVAQNNGGVRSSSTRYQQASYRASTDSLSFDDEVPIYDARHTAIDASRDIDNLDRILPRYTRNGGEIPNNSCAVVAYTVSQWRNVQKDEESVSFNIRWAVVLAEPGGV
ncbi:hypothetical protein R3P38DRAFT_2792069 [Favolaschia claudopus]|uniref:Uncharacterized protein n=1 Tax=Favolaschia claudopus TaxID=2862362 RepID=A0AAW0AF99_9AGAR